MASVCIGDSDDYADCSSESAMDERELTLASNDFIPPTFSPVRRPAGTLFGRTKRGKKRFSTSSTPQLKIVPPSPLEVPELSELDLESTLKARGSASSSSSDVMTRSGSVGSHGVNLGVSNSYMRAVTDGRFMEPTTSETTSVQHRVSSQ